MGGIGRAIGWRPASLILLSIIIVFDCTMIERSRQFYAVSAVAIFRLYQLHGVLWCFVLVSNHFVLAFANDAPLGTHKLRFVSDAHATL